MIRNLTDLEAVRQEFENRAAKLAHRIIICGGSNCVSNGSLEVRAAFEKELKAAGIDVVVDLYKEDTCGCTYLSKSGCQGFCQMGPNMYIEPAHIHYVKVKPADVPEIISKTLLNGEVIERLLYRDPATGKTARNNDGITFYNLQKRVVLKESAIEPDDPAEYIAKGGYFGARKALTGMTPEEICNTVLESGLRGRGQDRHRPRGRWKYRYQESQHPRYILSKRGARYRY